jgi:hypothetical protein
VAGWLLAILVVSSTGQDVEAMVPLQTLSDEVVLAHDGKGRGPSTADDGWRFTRLLPDATGLTAVHRSGREGADKRFMIECVGAGVGLFDVDDDGDLDAYLVQGGTVDDEGAFEGASDALFLNDGSGRFGPAREARPADGFGFGVVAGDVDGDGDEDVYVAQLGANALLENLGDGRLRALPDAGGAAGAPDEWSMGGCFADADRDGDLDLYVTNYLHHDLAHHMLSGQPCQWMGCDVPCGPQGLEPQADRFWLNDGSGAFQDATEASGLGAAKPAYGFQPVFGDLDQDGDPDLFVANDSMDNALFVNQGVDDHGMVQFVERGMTTGVALSDSGKQQAGMGVAVGDLDGDLLPDLVMTNFSREANAAFVNAGSPERGPMFFDEGNRTGVGRPSYLDLGWGTSLADLDHDGDRDLFVANGHVYAHVDDCGLSDVTYAQADQLYEQALRGRFQAPDVPGLEPERSSRGAAAGDLDGDGDLDLLVGELDGPAVVLRNDTPQRGSWIGVDLRPAAASVGARVEVVHARGRQAGEIRRGSSFLGTEPRQLHLGLGEVIGPVSVHVRWPDGHTEIFDGLAADATVTLTRGDGTP